MVAVLLFLAFLFPLLLRAGGAGERIGFFVVLLAPILHLAGVRLRAAARAGVLTSCLIPAGAQVVLGTFLVGGATYTLFSRMDGIGGGLFECLVLGLALSLEAPGMAPRLPGSSSRQEREPPRLFSFREAHSALVLLLAAPLLSLLVGMEQGLGERTLDVEPLAVLKELAIGLAAGSAAGLLGSLLLRFAGTLLPPSLLHLVAALAAVFSAMAAGGSFMVAAIVSGILCGGQHPDPRRQGPARNGPEIPGSLGLLVFLSSAGLLATAGRSVDPLGVMEALPGALALWGTSVALRFLIQLGFGGMQSWIWPRQFPGRWLPALAWSAHPGAVSVGVLFMVLGEARGDPDVGGYSSSAPVLAMAISLLLQGATARAVLLRAGRGTRAVRVHDRWNRLLAASIALRAEGQAVDELQASGELDEEVAIPMKEAIARGERRVESARSEISLAEPDLQAARLNSAVRAVLAAAREKVTEARLRGWIDSSAAEEVEQDLARRWSRSENASLLDLLGGLMERESTPPSRGEGAVEEDRGR